MAAPTRLEQRSLEHGMFADSLLETSRAEYAHRSWTTFTSFTLEALAVSLLLLLPLWKTVGLPAVRNISTPLSFAHHGDPAPTNPTGHFHSTMTTIVAAPRLMMPTHIPTQIQTGPDPVAPSQPIGEYIGSNGPSNNFPIGIVGMPSGEHPMPVAAMPKPKPSVPEFRRSSLLEGNLIRRVQPTYPSLARSARIQGAVVLDATISKAGTIENLRLISGHPMLVPAAIEAVSQWRYRPYILNDEPIEVETQITVNFILGGS